MKSFIFLFGLFNLLALCHSSLLTWTTYTPTGDIPLNVTEGAFEYGHNGYAYLVGGQREIFNPRNITFTDDVWSFEIANKRWTQLSIDYKPSARVYPASIYSKYDGLIYIYGGTTFENDYFITAIYADLWSFNIATQTFTLITNGTGPGPRGTAKFYQIENYLYLFGGISLPLGFAPTYENDIWRFNIDTQEWTQIDVVGQLPAPRSSFQQYQFGLQLYANSGETFSPPYNFPTLNDTWAFNVLDQTWRNVTGTQPPGRYNAASSPLGLATWVIHGGEQVGNQVGGCGAPFTQDPSNETWIFNSLTQVWTQDFPSGEAPQNLKRLSGIQVGLYDVWMFFGYNFICPGPGQIFPNLVYQLTLV